MIRSITTALRTLTILPIPGKDTDKFSSSLPFFPIAGGLIAAVVVLISEFILMAPDIHYLSGIILVGATVLLTGALHIDGLADVADGFGGGKSKEHILEIFKDSRLGTFGVIAVIFDLLIKIVMYSWYYEKHNFLIITISLVWSRMFQAVALSFVTPATPTKGIASSFTGGKYKVQVIISFVLLVSFSFIICKNTIVFIPIVIAFVSVVAFVLFCIKKITGITGDCIGAINELTEVSILFTGCIIGNLPMV